ncbi:MGDG synthase family glycosyltransferase [Peribacillus kribbensis]|uniref:MGDG synthase family glycosyltransferase n=1 Tax=Peribacillus kribbensis TaxID=356658 RepID=UPI00040E3847|nr:glycosyltransferase [Peribacillus kribbensis]
MKKTDKKKILILSANFGDGHKQVAKAITEAAEGAGQEIETITLDIMEWTHPRLYPLSHFIYIRGIKKLPFIYSFLYKNTREPSYLSAKLNSILASGLEQVTAIIKDINPSVVVSTYPFAAGIMSKIKEAGLSQVPAITVITDYTDHSYWIHPYTDQYLVGSKEVGERLISLGVEPEKIKNTGIPIRQRFSEVHSKAELSKKYKLEPGKYTVLVMGGGDGLLGNGLSTLHALERIPKPLQIFFVCGRNKKLQNQLENRLNDSIHSIRVLGYFEKIDELMAVSDLMITKPGGVTISEAMAMELPMLIHNPLPGQEEDNADYLLHEGFAILAKSNRDVNAQLKLLFSESGLLKQIKSRIHHHQRNGYPLQAFETILRCIPE